NRDTLGGAVHDVVGNYRAREAELGEDRDLAGIEAGIARNDGVGARVHANGRESATAQPVGRHRHAVGTIDVDAVPVLPVAPGIAADVADVVAGNERAVEVLVRRRGPDADRAVGARADQVALDDEPARVEREDAFAEPGDDAVPDASRAALEVDP